MKKLLIFDYNNLLIRGMAVVPFLSHKGKFTSGIFGMFKQMVSYTNKHRPDSIVVCTDTSPYERKLIYPDYKRRGEPNEQFFAQLTESKNYCDDVLKRLGIPILTVAGMEADDLIANIAVQYNDKIEQIFIVSNDSDLYQLLEYRNVILDKGKLGYYTLNSFQEEYNIPIQDWVHILCLSGTHNAVPNLKHGIGVKTAIKIWYDEQKRKELLDQYQQEYKRNYSLIKLPFCHIPISNLSVTPRGRRVNMEYCLQEDYGISVKDKNTDKFLSFIFHS